MAEHNETGKLGEEIAVEYLRKKGYEILRRNYRHRKAEIDIIALYNNEIIFVEVKTRHSNYIMEPEFSVSVKKQRLIITAADFFLTSSNIDKWSRFDIISIVLHPEGREIRHLENAFTPS